MKKVVHGLKRGERVGMMWCDFCKAFGCVNTFTTSRENLKCEYTRAVSEYLQVLSDKATASRIPQRRIFRIACCRIWCSPEFRTILGVR